MKKKVVIAATELHRGTGKMLKRVALQDEHLVVERDGYPVAVLMSYRGYEKLMREHALAAHRELVRSLGKDAEKQGLTEDDLKAELEEDRRILYQQAYGSDPS